MKRTLLTAHSGCLDTAPNSLAHVHAALDAQADLVEVDVRWDARRQRLILSHDADFAPAALTLDDVWDAVLGAGAGFNLDVKEATALEPLARFLETHAADFGVVTGCGAQWLREMRRLSPQTTVLFNVETGPAAGEIPSAWEDRMVREARLCAAAALNADHRLVTEDLVRKARRAALPLFVWTVNDEASLRRMDALGVDNVTTDRLDLAHRILTGF